MSDELSRHLAAVMFTDMAGYTALMRQDEAAALLARRRHRQALEGSLDGRRGEVLQYFGDGSLSIFASTVEAVDAAIDIQTRLQGRPSIRIGLHAGEIAYDVQGAYGDTVNIAARLEALCPPGGVTISHKIYDDIRQHPRIPVVALGMVRLKNVDEAVPIYALATEGLVLPRPVDPSPPEDSSGEGLPESVRARLEELDRLPTDPLHGVATVPGRIPMVGRGLELQGIQAALERAEAGRASAVFIRGPRGVGKTRLTQEAARLARERNWIVLRGRAQPSERSAPYAAFADALMPLLRNLELETLARLTPGSDAALCALFPSLGASPRPVDVGSTAPDEVRTRLYWQFGGLLARLSAHRPLLLVLEDLDFADRASLELLDSVIRQSRGERITFMAEYAGTDPERARHLRTIEHAIRSGESGRVFELRPLDEEAAVAFVRHAFDLDEDDAERLARAVFTWSQGNPFFMTGTLRGLVDEGVLRGREGRWKVGDVASIPLPHSVRDAVLVWTGRLSGHALELARSLAILGRQASYEVLREISGLTDDDLAPSLDELVRHQLVSESESRWALVYAFRNPILRETLRSELPLAARRALHARVARALEGFYADARDEHADELAYHFGRAHDRASAEKTIHYLSVAGAAALERQANREAADYFAEALDRLDATPRKRGSTEAEQPIVPVLWGLARARRRLGETAASVAAWKRLGAYRGDPPSSPQAGVVELEIGLTLWAAGALEEAIEYFDAAAGIAERAGHAPRAIRARLAQAVCHQYVGDVDESARLIALSLADAERLDEPRLLGRVQRSRIQHLLWTGHIAEAREAAQAALELVGTSSDPGVEFWSRWALGALEGLVGNTRRMEAHIEAAGALARDLASPLLDVATRELAVELSYARGEWAEGIRMGTEAIELARSTEQRLVLPRLLVWVSLMHMARGDLGLAERLIDEAWTVSEADGAERPTGFTQLHAVVPAHIGRASLHLFRGEWNEAVRVAEAGLRIADRSGYIVWAVHHILPIIGEAAIHARQLDQAAAVGVRMRAEAERMGHPLGLAWADACDAVLGWLQNDAAEGVHSLRRGIEAMEAIPLVYESARLRRQLAGRLHEVGDTEAALDELRIAHDAFVRLGARPELSKARAQFTEMGAEPPVLPPA